MTSLEVQERLKKNDVLPIPGARQRTTGQASWVERHIYTLAYE